MSCCSSNNCNGCGCTPCNCDTACDPDNEPLSSALNNFIASFYGIIVKTCVNNQIVWVLPCDLDTGIPGYPRIANEGLACYFVRVFSDVIAGAKIKVSANDTTPGLLEDKIAAGSEIQITVLNPGADEELQIAYSLPASQAVSASNIDWSAGYVYRKTLSGNTTFTFSNATDGKTIVVAVTNTVGNFTAAWPVAVQWTNGTEPTLTLGAKTDVFTFVDVNGTIYGSVAQNFS